MYICQPAVLKVHLNHMFYIFMIFYPSLVDLYRKYCVEDVGLLHIAGLKIAFLSLWFQLQNRSQTK